MRPLGGEPAAAEPSSALWWTTARGAPAGYPCDSTTRLWTGCWGCGPDVWMCPIRGPTGCRGKRALLDEAALSLFVLGERRLTFTSRVARAGIAPASSVAGYGEKSVPWANALREDLLGNSGILRGDPGQGYFFSAPDRAGVPGRRDPGAAG